MFKKMKLIFFILVQINYSKNKKKIKLIWAIHLLKDLLTLNLFALHQF